MAASAIKSSPFSFHPKMIGFPASVFTNGVDVNIKQNIEKYQINASYIRVLPYPKIIERLRTNFYCANITSPIETIRKYVNYCNESIEWKFEEIDVSDLLRIFDIHFPLNMNYSIRDIKENIHLLPRFPLTEKELFNIFTWYQKMGRITTINIHYALFETFDNRIIHINGLLEYMNYNGGSTSIIRDVNDMSCPSLPTWYSELPPDNYVSPNSFLNLLNLYIIGKWYDSHVE